MKVRAPAGSEGCSLPGTPQPSKLCPRREAQEPGARQKLLQEPHTQTASLTTEEQGCFLYLSREGGKHITTQHSPPWELRRVCVQKAVHTRPSPVPPALRQSGRSRHNQGADPQGPPRRSRIRTTEPFGQFYPLKEKCVFSVPSISRASEACLPQSPAKQKTPGPVVHACAFPKAPGSLRPERTWTGSI